VSQGISALKQEAAGLKARINELKKSQDEIQETKEAI
jgi:prefoldin subunit 5